MKKGATRSSLLSVIAALAASQIHCTAGAVDVIYVNAAATGEGDGSSWDDAYTDLHDALAAAMPGAQIWIAAGEYLGGYPGETFQLVGGVHMYGGFLGWERELEQRDWMVNQTVLHGGDLILSAIDLVDPVLLDGLTIKDGFNWNGPAGLLVINSEITIANCTFVGNTTMDWIIGGGAIAALDAALTITNSVFESNVSVEIGGAIRSFDSVIYISQSTFDSNSATFDGGALSLSQEETYIADSLFVGNTAGAGAAVQGGNLQLLRCTFTNNWGDGYGAAVIASGLIEDSTFMNNEGGAEISNDAIIRRCQFIGNSSDGGFGGVEITSAGTVEIVDCLFQWNSAYVNGGGLLINTSGSAVVSKCHFTGNVSSNNDGGGIMVKGGGQVHVTDSIIEGNFAEYGGAASVENGSLVIERCTVIDNWGGLHAGFGGSLTVIDSVIADNTIEGVIVRPGVGGSAQATIINSLIASNLGDGVHVGPGPDSLATVINSTIVNNTGTFPGTNGGVFVKAGHADVRNSIVWGNGSDNGGDTQSGQISAQNGTIDVQHSIIEGLIPGGAFDVPGAGMNNLGDDPLFVDPNPTDGKDADFRLQPRSPAIDAGENAFVPDPDEFPGAETDLDGNPRIVDGTGDGVAIVDLGAYEFQPSVPSIPGDLNGDGSVGVADLLILLSAWGACADCDACAADLTGDCAVGAADLLVLLANWG